jgi:hypothetical protein
MPIGVEISVPPTGVIVDFLRRTGRAGTDGGILKRLPIKERIMKRAWILGILLLPLACTWPFARADGLIGPPSSAASPSTQPDIALEFPPDLDLKVLIQYVGDRLGINFMLKAWVFRSGFLLWLPVFLGGFLNAEWHQ